MPARSTAQSVILPPPVLGLNTVDPIASMDVNYCISALNFFSDGYSVDLRRGFTDYARGIGGEAVQFIGELNLQNGTSSMLAAGDDGHIYNASASGVATDLTLASKVAGTPQSINFKNLLFITDTSTSNAVYTWDGTTAAVAGFTGPGGVDTTLFCPTVFKGAIAFLELNSASLWHAPAGAITGALTEFPVEDILTLGGKLIYCGPISRQNIDDQDYFILVSSRGEVLVYQGDGFEESTWSLVGHYYISSPLSERAFIRYGADVVVLTRQGIVSLRNVITSAVEDIVYLSDKINNLYQDILIDSEGNENQWSGVWYPKRNWIIVQMLTGGTIVPQYSQLVLNTKTRSWWLWDLPAYSFGVFKEQLYLGGNQRFPASTGSGRMFKADNGYADITDENGTISTRTIKLQQAFSNMGSKLVKQFTEAVPYVYMSEGLALTMDVNVNFQDRSATSSVSDLTDTVYKLYTPRMGLQGIGKVAGIRIDQTVTTKRMSLQATEVFWNDGEII